MTTRYSTLFSVILLAASLSLHAAPASPYTDPVDSLLKVYDAMVSESDRYVARRQAAIDSLEALPFSAAHALQVAELYVPYRSDSALHYYNLAIGAGDGDMAVLASIRRIRLLASIGNYASAYRERDKLGHIPPHLLLMYYDALYRLYSEAAMVSRLQSYTDCYNAAANAYSDSLINFCEEHNVRPTEYYRRCITRANNRRDFLSAMAYTDSAFARLTPEMHDYAIIAFERAVIYRETGDRQMFVQWLIRSAITDVHCGVTDNGSSWMIAEEVYNSGDLKRAHRYINYSVSNANIFNANPRYQQVAPLALIISRTYEDEQQEFNFRLWAVVFLLIAVIIAIVVAVIIAHRCNKELHTLNAQLLQLNNQLRESNMVKEQYICRYLEVYSNMIDRMTRMARKTEKDPDAFLRKEMAVFYRDFDQTFIALYPTFINEFNALLRPDARITPKQGDILTTELRIFALIRLGIDASAKIAELLRYAPNTIYNYRAQIRNAAINGKDEFEQYVRHIGRHNL